MEALTIVAPSVVALAAIAATWHQHGRGLEHARELEDLRAVRGLLDDAAIALHETAYTLDEVRSQLTQHGGVAFFKTDAGTKLFRALGESGRKLDALVERLKIRLGPARPAVVAYASADETVLCIYRAAGLMRLEPESDEDSLGGRQVRALNDEKRSEIERARSDFDDAREEFINHANALAGAKLRR